MITPSIILILLLLNTVGCSFAYQPLGLRGGYSETEIDDSTIVVRYNAPSGFLQYPAEFTREQHIQFFVLYRCAELTVLKGRDYFVVIDSTIPIQVANSYSQPISHRVVHVVSAGAVVGAIGEDSRDLVMCRRLTRTCKKLRFECLMEKGPLRILWRTMLGNC